MDLFSYESLIYGEEVWLKYVHQWLVALFRMLCIFDQHISTDLIRFMVQHHLFESKAAVQIESYVQVNTKRVLLGYKFAMYY